MHLQIYDLPVMSTISNTKSTTHLFAVEEKDDLDVLVQEDSEDERDEEMTMPAFGTRRQESAGGVGREYRQFRFQG